VKCLDQGGVTVSTSRPRATTVLVNVVYTRIFCKQGRCRRFSGVRTVGNSIAGSGGCRKACDSDPHPSMTRLLWAVNREWFEKVSPNPLFTFFAAIACFNSPTVYSPTPSQVSAHNTSRKSRTLRIARNTSNCRSDHDACSDSI